MKDAALASFELHDTCPPVFSLFLPLDLGETFSRLNYRVSPNSHHVLKSFITEKLRLTCGLHTFCLKLFVQEKGRSDERCGLREKHTRERRQERIVADQLEHPCQCHTDLLFVFVQSDSAPCLTRKAGCSFLGDENVCAVACVYELLPGF